MSVLDRMRNNLDSFAPTGTIQNSSSAGIGMTPQTGNPSFVSQIDLNISIVHSYHEVSFDPAGPDFSVTSEIRQSHQVPPNLQVPLPVYLFGASDKASNFRKCSEIQSVENWIFYGGDIVKNSQESVNLLTLGGSFAGNYTVGGISLISMAVNSGKAKKGDLILRYYYPAGSAGTSAGVYMVEVIIKCSAVSYGTLLDSISSDTFIIDGIRYNVSDVTKIAQFEHEILAVRQSMFGKLSTDSINPLSMKLPTNLLPNIIDVPVRIGIDKNQMLITSINYDVPQFTWSLFIPTVNKIKA